jgi:ribokinase
LGVRRIDVMVVGSINEDLVATVAHAPAPGQTVLAEALARGPGGKGANQAVAASVAGASTAMLARVGDDASGAAQIAALEVFGVDVSRVRAVAGEATGLAMIVVTASGENSIVVAAGANARLGVAEVAAALEPLDERAVVVVQTEIAVAVVEEVAEICRRRSLRLVLNCAPVVQLSEAALAVADPLVVNEHEARELLPTGVGATADAGTGEVVDELANVATRLRAALGTASAVVTLGARGAHYAGADTADTAGAVRAAATTVVDTTGAGDWFVGSLGASLGRGSDLAEATRAATAAAAHAVGWRGARPLASRSSDK